MKSLSITPGANNVGAYINNINLKDIDRIETVSTEESIEKSKLLAKQYGLFIGFSAAANFLVAERLIEEGYGKNIVTILCDRGERYFSCL